MITLSLLHPLSKDPVQHWDFEHESIIRIGRSTDNNVVLYSAVVSRHHVELRKGDDGWEIVNLGTNGTYLDGKRVAQVAVEDGIVIRLARSGPNIQIKLHEDGNAAGRDLSRLRSAVLAHRQQAAPTAAVTAANTEIHPHEDTVSSILGDEGAEDDPTSGTAGYPGPRSPRG